MLDMIQTANENDLQFNIILPRCLSKLKDNYHTQGTQWVENNSGLMVSLLSTVIQILKKENILSRPAHSEFHCIVLH